MFSSALRNSNLLEAAKVRYIEIWFAAANVLRFCSLLAKLESLLLTSFATAKYDSLQQIGPSLPFAAANALFSGLLPLSAWSSLQRKSCFLVFCFNTITCT